MLWVRSQDKSELVKVFEIYVDNNLIKANFKSHYNGCQYIDLGEYKTKERALEVLDEIQKKINLINLGRDFRSPMIDFDNPTYIYEMPQD